MSRLTDTEYLIRHESLAWLWKGDLGRFGYLSMKQQQDLHAYYLTTRQLSDEELFEHRTRITKAQPSLPHRASRAYLALLRPPAQPASAVPKGKRHAVIIQTIIKPDIDIDVDALARTLIDLVASLPPEKRAKLAAEGRERQNVGRETGA